MRGDGRSRGSLASPIPRPEIHLERVSYQVLIKFPKGESSTRICKVGKGSVPSEVRNAGCNKWRVFYPTGLLQPLVC